jgi:hypothetical protein
MVARRHAARDLDVDQLVGHASLRGQRLHQVAATLQPALAIVGVVDAHLAQAALQPRHVLVETEQALAIDRHHLVDAVAKDEAAVQYRHLGVAHARVLAVQVARRVGQWAGHVGFSLQHACSLLDPKTQRVPVRLTMPASSPVASPSTAPSQQACACGADLDLPDLLAGPGHDSGSCAGLRLQLVASPLGT